MQVGYRFNGMHRLHLQQFKSVPTLADQHCIDFPQCTDLKPLHEQASLFAYDIKLAGTDYGTCTMSRTVKVGVDYVKALINVDKANELGVIPNQETLAALPVVLPKAFNIHAAELCKRSFETERCRRPKLKPIDVVVSNMINNTYYLTRH
ncbi:hypothetical protein BDB00DRAFT_878941 [Zychaea mexicana]|uniref:uncharacterized protein n=1 Tax=Zychaea mexicana TaxID=64656 RepID=UPI0022FE139E|nr:uncharacterized protein BDB00DRAFT_878941 [Zychaea mexicana]KAI9484364.1 hypothetical protein BDB00DRAFT_878941 [Zychaea mexicana]